MEFKLGQKMLKVSTHDTIAKKYSKYGLRRRGFVAKSQKAANTTDSVSTVRVRRETGSR